MNKISAREKTLLAALAVIAVAVFGFMFLVKPAMATRQENTKKIEGLQSEKALIDIDVNQGPTIKKQLQESKEMVIANSATFYTNVATWEAERLVTDLQKKHKIDYKSISVTPPQPYVASVLPIYDEGETPPQPKVEDKNAVGATVITVSSEFTCATIAEVENLKAFLDEKSKETQQTSVASWSYTFDKSKKNYRGQLVVNFYCMDITKLL